MTWDHLSLLMMLAVWLKSWSELHTPPDRVAQTCGDSVRTTWYGKVSGAILVTTIGTAMSLDKHWLISM